ncbi:MAG: permease-like cell division protein FtsX [Erysipelothrix sp.]|nr:permease-like cell division protein FtsX [Erysipelothrix sp.]
MSRILRHLKEAFIGLIRHMAMTLSSISTITITLLFVGLFLVITLNIEQFTYAVEGSVNIHVKIDPRYEDDASVNTLGVSIRSLVGVKTATFSSKDNELDEMIASFGESGVIFESYRGPDNPLRMAYLVEIEDGVDIEVVASSIRNLEGVEAVAYGGVRVIELLALLENIRQFVYILVAGLGLIAIFLIANTIKLSIASRSLEIQIMRTVGATNGFIRIPFLFEGILIGLFGSIFPIALIAFGYIWLFDTMGGQFVTPMFALVQPFPFVYYVSSVMVLIAITVGLFGSGLSVGKHLRWKR